MGSMRECEARFREIFGTDACATVVGADGYLRESNAAGLAILEADSLQQARQQPLVEYVLPEYRAAFDALHRRVMKGESGTLELELKGLGGRRRWLETHASPLRDAGGQVTDMLGIFRDIAERMRTDEVVRDYSGRLQQLSRKLMKVEEEERRRLGRELHDRTGSNLSALLMNFEFLRARLPAASMPELGPRLDDCEALLRETMQHVRDVTAELRPPALEELGLFAALNHHVYLLSRRSGREIQLEGAEPSPRLRDDIEIALFRVAQEALNNATKHAQATHISVALRQKDGRITLVVADDGKGFDRSTRQPDASRVGLLTMRERAHAIGARFSVESSIGQGTRVMVEVSHKPFQRGTHGTIEPAQ
jgi:two-component system, NarL family, sensor histidine kinase UhpB